MTPREIHAILKAIGANWLHHANSVTTSGTFLQQGALLSRNYVAVSGLRQTSQESDDIDKHYGIWNRVFLDHVNIHKRGGRSKGGNKYGPVLFELSTDVLLQLPSGSRIEVTRANPTNWAGTTSDDQRIFTDIEDLKAKLSFGDFDKMLMLQIPNERLEFPDRSVKILLDDPQRALASGEQAFENARKHLLTIGEKSKLRVSIEKHECREGCKCVAIYRGWGQKYFDSRFSGE